MSEDRSPAMNSEDSEDTTNHGEDSNYSEDRSPAMNSEDRSPVMNSGILDELPPEEDEIVTDPDTGDLVAVKLKPLTLREELFVREYCRNFDVRETAKAVGLTRSAANGFLQRKNVKAAIHKKARAIATSADMSEEWVMQHLKEVVERCMDKERFDPSCALRGLELVGKRFAMFTDRIEKAEMKVIRIESNVNIPIPKGLE